MNILAFYTYQQEMNIKNEIMEKYMFFVFNMFYILLQMTFYVFSLFCFLQ
jgi:hypothetical protein